ncbi:hypothetical protein CUV01_12945 [Paracoccus tegillarcae]|uniref:Uncharacterized protein n=1 Tax=Paracoccus tegillarcae TaxID=1529068 RepID=A0A2K9F4V5_9RHOB|nr:hypothetical protein CUV01_12945 [Paracoccus tegillarcae]
MSPPLGARSSLVPIHEAIDVVRNFLTPLAALATYRLFFCSGRLVTLLCLVFSLFHAVDVILQCCRRRTTSQPTEA